MNETRLEQDYIDIEFGFPIIIQNVPMEHVNGQWVEQIDRQNLTTKLLKHLALKSAKLTGTELKFIRQKLKMTLANFANRFYVSHPAVLKWEKFEDEPTNMNWSTEKDIRLFVLSKVIKKNPSGVLLRAYRQFENIPQINSIEDIELDLLSS